MSQRDKPLNFDILDHLPQGTFILRRDGIVTFWNVCLEGWTNISPSTIVGTSIERHFPHLGTSKYSSRFEPLFEGGPPATFASQFHPQFLPCSLPNGQPRIQQTIAKAIWDEPTQEWQALVIIQDISDLHRQVAESQRLRKQAQAEIRERQKHGRLLEAIRHIESTFISTKNANQTFDEVLTQLLTITESAYGFFGEVRYQDEQPYLKTHAITNIAWDEETRALYDRYAPNMEFSNLNTLFGKVLTTREYVISNTPQTDPRRSGLPKGHPALHAFLGVPIFYGEQFLGMAGLGNRPQGYDEQLVEYLQPLLTSCGTILHAYLLEQEQQTIQIALEKSEERLTLATASAQMGIWDWDIPHNILTWDSRMYELYGVTSQEFSGAYEAWTQGVHPDDREHAAEEMRLALEGKKHFNTEFRVIWNDQSIHVIAARGTVQRDEAGNAHRMIGVNWDITNRKYQEENRLHLQRAIDQGDEGVALLNSEGHYTYLNQAHAEMYGYSVEELLGQSWKILYSKDQLRLFDQECFPRLRDAGKWQGELVGLRKNGTNFPVDVSLSLLFHENKTSAGLVCTCRDMTERKGAEEKFRLVVEAAPSGMIMIDRQGMIVLANHLVSQLFGYSREELLGKTIDSLVPERFRPQHPAHRDGFFANPQPRAMGSGRDLFGLRKDGTEFPVELGLNPLATEEGTFVLASVVDITQRKKAEVVITETTRALEQQNQELAATRDEALAAARSKADFLATMSHEIRTPLNGVIGMTDLLLSTGLDAEQQEMVGTVKLSGEFLLNIINDILDYSKIDAERMELECIEFDIRTVVDEVLDILTERASQKCLELIGIVYASTPQYIRGDPGRIRQILFNLLGNAIKFTEKGEVVLDVSVLENDADTTTLRFAITDSGIGIEAKAQRRLFESFTQADNSTTRKFGGTGLGLAICKQLVTLMQGEIGVMSEIGQGSTFWFTLPLLHGSSSSPRLIPPTPLQGRRVCIVESNDTIRFLLQHYIQSWGMIGEVAKNGDEGFALMTQRAKENHPFDLALLDHTLSHATQEDGLSLAKKIRQHSKIFSLPLVLLTAFGTRGEGKLAQQAGFHGYLTKPIRHRQLRQCLQMIVSPDSTVSSTTANQPSHLITRHTVEEAQASTQANILLAEDNVVNQKVAVRMLKKLGYRVDVVANGQEAVQAIDGGQYDLVLMDCQMPEMDGLEATRTIRQAESQKVEGRSEKDNVGKSELKEAGLASNISLLPSPLHVPIIALTANALSKDRETCLEAGMDDFLSKPVRIEELSAMIRQWLPAQKRQHQGGQSMTILGQLNKGLSPCLDDSILENLKSLGGEDDPEFFLSVVDQFLGDLPRYERGIQQAVERQHADDLVKAAHTCKGSARSIGAISLADISYALEQLGREGAVASAPEKFKQWLTEKDRTVSALQLERDKLTQEIKSEKGEEKSRK